MNVNWNDSGFEGFAKKSPFSVRSVNRARKERKPIKSPGARMAVNLAVTLVFGAIYYYLALPVINFKAGSFYVFVILLCLVYSFTTRLTAGSKGEDGYFRFVKKRCRIPLFITLGLLLVATAAPRRHHIDGKCLG
jgi:hypothetical protein